MTSGREYTFNRESAKALFDRLRRRFFRVTRASEPCLTVMRRQSGLSRGFTLIELLVVIAIIAIVGILASMTMVVIAEVHERGRITEAQREIHALYNAIEEYHADTGAYPVSNEVLAQAVAAHSDFTFGFSVNNSEVMAILLNRERYSTGAPTANFNHARNKRQKFYLTNVPPSGLCEAPAIGAGPGVP
jgi:prepilin-type N-terminal cleavage/methylation domain-containing protein